MFKIQSFVLLSINTSKSVVSEINCCVDSNETGPSVDLTRALPSHKISTSLPTLFKTMSPVLAVISTLFTAVMSRFSDIIFVFPFAKILKSLSALMARSPLPDIPTSFIYCVFCLPSQTISFPAPIRTVDVPVKSN